MTLPPHKLFLCYVDGPWAWFTSQEVTKQWGDDWNDAPYEHNAGDPYAARPESGQSWQLVKVAYDGDFQTPASKAGMNSQLSVEMINAGHAPWLIVWGSAKLICPAGISLRDFKCWIRANGGNVYTKPPIYTLKDGGVGSGYNMEMTEEYD